MRSAIAIKTIGTQQRTINPIECDALGCLPSFGAGRGAAVELAGSAAPAGIGVVVVHGSDLMAFRCPHVPGPA